MSRIAKKPGRTLMGLFYLLLLAASTSGQGSLTSAPIAGISGTMNTADKPQSKTWEYDGFWWAVFPDTNGTHIWRLDKGNIWTSMLTISKNTNTKADCKKAGERTYILLFDGAGSELINTQYNAGNITYELLNADVPSRNLSFNGTTETVTIDIDGKDVMWLAYEEDNSIKVNSSVFPYTVWGEPTIIETGVKPDDICSIISLPGKIGVLWSNQNTKLFGFKTHVDGNDQITWSADEHPASQSQLNVGDGLADDHLNVAVSSDGTLYCAVKTSFDTPGYPLISLLKRNHNGTWDDLYFIDDEGTRPIVVIGESRHVLQVIYTDIVSGGNIVYVQSDLSSITFGNKHVLISGENINNASSTKDNYDCDLVVIASTQSSPITIVGSLISRK